MPQPVTAFLRQGLLLKAAIAACLKKASPKRVHHLRSTTRRIEATLELLVLSADIPGIDKQSKPLQRSVGRVRRAAGIVRDADVQSDLLDRLQSHSRFQTSPRRSRRRQKKSRTQTRQTPRTRAEENRTPTQQPRSHPQPRVRSQSQRRKADHRHPKLVRRKRPRPRPAARSGPPHSAQSLQDGTLPCRDWRRRLQSRRRPSRPLRGRPEIPR